MRGKGEGGGVGAKSYDRKKYWYCFLIKGSGSGSKTPRNIRICVNNTGGIVGLIVVHYRSVELICSFTNVSLALDMNKIIKSLWNVVQNHGQTGFNCTSSLFSSQKNFCAAKKHKKSP